MSRRVPADIVIAIDGPAGSGKSTLGEALAERLGYTYFDSGVMYRALAWLALQRSVDPQDETALVKLAESAEIQVTRPTQNDGRQATVLVDGADVTWAIRTTEVDRIVSPVAAQPGIRRVVTDRLRQIGLGGAIVMVGRDIGTVVMPDAGLKIYLTASGEERARRRHRDLQARQLLSDYDYILAEIHRRDAHDAGRDAAPMRPADGAIHMDSDTMTVEDEVRQVLRQLGLEDC